MKERDWVDQVAKVWRMFEEEHASKFGINDVWVTTWHTDKVQSLLPAVSTSPECQRRLVLPAGTGVCLNRHHVQWHSETAPQSCCSERNNVPNTVLGASPLDILATESLLPRSVHTTTTDYKRGAAGLSQQQHNYYYYYYNNNTTTSKLTTSSSSLFGMHHISA